MVEKTAKTSETKIEEQIKPPAEQIVAPPSVDQPSHHSTEKPTETVPQKQNFFDDFHHSSDKKFRYTLFVIFALLAVGILYLLKPTIESILLPKSNYENYIPVSQEPTSMHLVISNPEDELLTFDKAINISGKTSPKSSIVISNGDLNWATDADDEGEFAKVIDLKSGVNPLIIYAFDLQGNNKNETRTIYMSEEKL